MLIYFLLFLWLDIVMHTFTDTFIWTNMKSVAYFLRKQFSLSSYREFIVCQYCNVWHVILFTDIIFT